MKNLITLKSYDNSYTRAINPDHMLITIRYFAVSSCSSFYFLVIYHITLFF